MDVVVRIMQDTTIPERVRSTFVGSIAFTAPEHLTPRLIESRVLAAYTKHGILPRFVAPLAPITEEVEEGE
jgi:hypothetical protein